MSKSVSTFDGTAAGWQAGLEEAYAQWEAAADEADPDHTDEFARAAALLDAAMETCGSGDLALEALRERYPDWDDEPGDDNS